MKRKRNGFLQVFKYKKNTDVQHIQIDNITVEVRKKNIRNLHLRLNSSEGSVRISAPARMDLDIIRDFAVSKLGWIKKKQARLKTRVREFKKEFISGESHFYLGKTYRLNVIELNQPPKVVLNQEILELYMRPNTGVKKRTEILNDWYRQRLKELIADLITKFEARMGVKVTAFGVKKMKTRWGSCNIKAKRIWLNLELAKKTQECIEYIVVHEITHLLERFHNERFKAFMDTFLPRWRIIQEELIKRPICHED